MGNPTMSFLQDPTNLSQVLGYGVPAVLSMADRWQQQNNPTLNAFVNNEISRYNSMQGAGNPYGLAGGFGSDAQGNPYSAAQAVAQYYMGQVNSGQPNFGAVQGGYQQLAQNAGIGALNFGGGAGGRGGMGQGSPHPIPLPGGEGAGRGEGAGGGAGAGGGLSMGYVPAMNPSGLQGVSPGQAYAPVAVPRVQTGQEQLQGWRGERQQERQQRWDNFNGRRQEIGDNIRGRIQNFLGSFAVGITNVPQDGMAQLHQGEMVVPKSMNPLAGSMPQPMAGQGGGRWPVAGGQGTGGTGGGGGTGGLRARSGMLNGTPMRASGNVVPQAGQAGYMGLQPGLNAGAQQAIINRGTEAIDQQFSGLQRQMREQAGSGGQVGSGALDRRMFDAQLGRIGQVGNLNRDVGIAAAQQDFQDRLAANNFMLQRDLGYGGMNLQQRGQNLDYAQGMAGLGVQSQLGNRGYDINQQQFGANYGRDLYNDALGYQFQQQQRNDQLMQNLLQMQYNGDALQQQRFEGLGGLLAQFA